MDELKLTLTTKLMKTLVTKWISAGIRKKFGCEIDIQLNELNVEIVDGKARLRTDVNLSMDSNDLMDILKAVSPI
jgi:hypothetical protein